MYLLLFSFVAAQQKKGGKFFTSFIHTKFIIYRSLFVLVTRTSKNKEIENDLSSIF